MSPNSSALTLATTLLIAGCAIGAPIEEAEESSLAETPMTPMRAGAGSSGVGGGGGGGSASPSPLPDASAPAFDGETCQRGETQACGCDDGQAMGERICIASTASPSGGELSECRGCPATSPDAGDIAATGGMGGASGMGGMGGVSGMSGMGGASGMSGMSGGSSGAGATGGMSGGAGGAAGAGGTAACSCMDLLQCCRPDGTCGVGLPGLCL